jgi:hypothetical protein
MKNETLWSLACLFTLLMIIGLVIVLCCQLKKVRPSPKLGPPVEAGQIWKLKADNPFSGEHIVRIVEVKDGWACYEYTFSAPGRSLWSKRCCDFRVRWKLVCED